MEPAQIVQNYWKVRNSLPNHVVLVVVSKHQAVEAIKTLYDAGQRIFGENRVQELLEKKQALPADIQWQLIGNLQSNKVKYIAPFVSLIQSVSNPNLLTEIDKQAKKNNRIMDCLIEVHIAAEESKSGFTLQAADDLLSRAANKQTSNFESMGNVRIRGLMGMATNTSDKVQVHAEFKLLSNLFRKYEKYLRMEFLSMGMTGDYPIAIEEGSNMVRIGTLIFGKRLSSL